MFTKLFWKDTAERTLATVAQVLITLLTVDGFDLLQADLEAVLASLVVAAVLVVAKCIVAGKATDNSVSPASLATDKRGF